MKIVVLCKYVPDATADRRFNEADHTTDRSGVDGLLSELDEYAVEEALALTEDIDAEIVALTVGPDDATDALRKALQMGADSAVHVCDDALAGSDAPATSAVLAAAISKIGDVDLVVTGMASTDGGMGLVPAMLAERLGLPHAGLLGEASLADGLLTGKRDSDEGSLTVQVSLPAIISVTDQINEPRYPSFKGIMAAKKKPVQTWAVEDLGLSGDQVGLSAAWSVVEKVDSRPPRSKGEVVVDDGNGGVALVDFLTAGKFA